MVSSKPSNRIGSSSTKIKDALEIPNKRIFNVKEKVRLSNPS
jgi:hypothetical protein